MSSKLSKLSQKDYLKKYLSGGEGKKKKKKVKEKSSTSSASVRTKIIDDDVDVSQIQPLDSSELEIYDTAEDGPQIAGIIDERPAELRAKEQYSNQKWKVLTDPLLGDVQTVIETTGDEDHDRLDRRPRENRHEATDDDDKWGRIAKKLEENREQSSDEDHGKDKRHKRKKHKNQEPPKKKKSSTDDAMHDKTVFQEEMDRERAELQAKEDEHKKHLEKYYKWGKGVKQLEERRERLLEEKEEMEKPLARYADDEELDQRLRDQEREGDPMLEYLRSKKSKDDKKDAKPAYRGPYPPNRYNIRPGHRWDGVDRSCGYEKKWFETLNARKAVEEEAYKWSSSDL